MANDDGSRDLAGFLGRLADSFCHSVVEHPGNVLLHVVPATEGWEVGVLHLDSRPPADVLLGLVAPERWVALGIAARGWARSLDASPGDGEPRRPTASALIVHRSGLVVSRLAVGDEVLQEVPAYGAVLDCLQRALGLPSAPPRRSSGEFFAATWLENVVVAASGRKRTLTCGRARALHPALQLLDRGGRDASTDELVDAALVLERVCDWDRLRRMVVEGLWPERNLTPAEAAWFDAGGFSRWVMSQRPPIETMLADLEQIVGPAVARCCAASLQRLGLLGRSPA